MAYILIIEDDRDIRNVTELILAEADHRVVTANDGLRGVELATCMQPDLILMDLGLPRLDGWKATQRIKANTATQHIPIIAFTAIISPAATKQALTAGCATVVTKPFDVDGRLEIITGLLAQQAPAVRKTTAEAPADQ